METEADMTDLAGSFCTLCHRENAFVQHMRPAIPVKGMQQIDINVVGLESSQFFIQNAVEIFFCLHLVHRDLGGQGHLLPVTILQAQAGDPLAVTIGVGGIHIGQAAVDGRTQILNGPLLIKLALCVFLQTHHAKA